MAYVLVLDELREQVAQQALAAQLGRVLGADVEVPSWYDARADFDAYLMAQPARTDPREALLDRALGMRG